MGARNQLILRRLRPWQPQPQNRRDPFAMTRIYGYVRTSQGPGGETLETTWA